MSASKEQRNQARTAREERERREARRSTILYAVVAVLFVAAAVTAFVWKSNIIQKNATAATVNGKKYSASQMQYYYGSIYQRFMQQSGSYLSFFGLDPSKPLREQECTIDEEGGTWFDYFSKQALEQAADIDALCAQADAAGCAWNDEMQASYDANMKDLNDAVAEYNQTQVSHISTEDYLQLVYGSLMSQKVYEAEMKKAVQARVYTDSYSDSLSYTDGDLTAAYEEDKTAYDMADYESVRINGTAESTKDADGNTVEPTEEEEAAAMEEARTTADQILEDFLAGKSLSELAEGNDDAVYSDNTNATYYQGVVLDWVFDESRKAGNIAMLADESAGAYYVVSFGRRFRPEFDVRDVRHILISPEEGEKKEGDEGYEAEHAQLMADAEKEAADLLSQYNAGEKTEEAFSALAEENSADTGSAVNGGLISGIHENSNYVENFKNWALDKHQPGDTGIVESDYGYHIMYYVGNEEVYWKSQVKAKLTSDALTAWYEEQTKDAAATAGSGMKYVG